MKRLALASFFAIAALAADPPQATIRNRTVTAKFYLPDPVNGYYRGTRFDWSGVIYSLRTANHEYFGQWFPKYDPKLHDAIMGPVEEFKTNGAGLGWDDAKPGDTFIRIGVGVVRREDNKQFNAFSYYPIVDPGTWRVRKAKNRISFTHTLTDKKGYAYIYTKSIRLHDAKPILIIEHTLKNTGTKRIQTSQYNHNFFMLDGEPTGTATVTKVPFELKATRPFANTFAEARGKEIRYNTNLETGQSTYAEFAGFGKTSADYDIRMENQKAGAGVHITGDQPLEKLVYWSIKTVFSPEPYIEINVEPGKEHKWTYKYEFYDLPK